MFNAKITTKLKHVVLNIEFLLLIFLSNIKLCFAMLRIRIYERYTNRPYITLCCCKDNIWNKKLPNEDKKSKKFISTISCLSGHIHLLCVHVCCTIFLSIHENKISMNEMNIRRRSVKYKR